MTFYFRVKFYVTDPSRLHEELTRYHVYLQVRIVVLVCDMSDVLYKSKRMILQVRKDIVEGRLGAPFSTLCLLTSYVAQAVIGDHDFDTCRPGYLAQFRDLRKLCLSAASNQLTQEDIERRISELHKLHKVC